MTIQQLLSRTGQLLSPDAPPTGGAPTGEGTVLETKGAGNLDVVPLSKAEYAELLAAKTERDSLKPKVATLEQNWNSAQALIKGEGDDTAMEQHTRHVLKAAGWSQGQIDSHLQGLREEGAPEASPSRSDGRGPRPKGASSSEDREEPSEIDTIRQQQQVLSQQLGQQEVHRLGRLFQEGVKSALDTTKDLTSVMEDLVKANAPSDEGKAKEYQDNLGSTVMAEVDREFKDRLRQRRAQNGNRWDDAWVPDEAAKAAKAVAAKFRTFVPDPSRIGKVGETGVGDDYITSTTPVSKPSFRKGDTVADVEQKGKAWAADYLIRGDTGAMKV